MTYSQFLNLLASHPNVKGLRTVAPNRLQFNFEFEIYHSDGGGTYECAIEAFMNPGVFIFYYVGMGSIASGVFDPFHVGRAPMPLDRCEKRILYGKFTPQTVCTALQQLIRSACEYKRGDDSQSFYIGDERDGRGIWNPLGDCRNA